MYFALSLVFKLVQFFSSANYYTKITVKQNYTYLFLLRTFNGAITNYTIDKNKIKVIIIINPFTKCSSCVEY